jgi:protein-L-isoaspartate(D-aspartate) O-methyltransferase
MGGAVRARGRMVQLVQGLGVRHPAVLAAMNVVPRDRFVDAALASRAYEDVALPIGLGQTISRPSTVGRMIELLVQGRSAAECKQLCVLEVGTGCGYQAAVLAQVFGEVFSVERLRGLHELARSNLRPLRLPNLRLAYGDGFEGLPDQGPFDAVIVAAAGDQVPEPLLLQMRLGARLVAPVHATSGQQVLHWVERVAPEDWRLHLLDAVRFVPLQRGTS